MICATFASCEGRIRPEVCLLASSGDALFSKGDLSDTVAGIIILVVALAILCICLVLIVKLLHSALKGKIARIIKKFINYEFPGCFGEFATGSASALRVNKNQLQDTQIPLLFLVPQGWSPRVHSISLQADRDSAGRGSHGARAELVHLHVRHHSARRGRSDPHQPDVPAHSRLQYWHHCHR